MVSVYVWMYKKFLTPKFSLSLGMCCTAGIRGDGVCCGSCNRAHLSLSLASEHMEREGERGKEGVGMNRNVFVKHPGIPCSECCDIQPLTMGLL